MRTVSPIKKLFQTGKRGGAISIGATTRFGRLVSDTQRVRFNDNQDGRW